MPNKNEVLVEEVVFTHNAIKALRVDADGKPKVFNGYNVMGIHSVYSGFNGAFRQYYGTDPVEATQRMEAKGKLRVKLVQGGAMLYIPGEANTQAKAKGKSKPKKQSALLTKILS